MPNVKTMCTAAMVAAGAFLVGWWGGAASAQQDPKTLTYELRTYTTLPGRLPALNKRFKDHTMALFAKHGMKNVIYLTPQGEDNKLVYLLAHDSKDAAMQSFAAFGNDPEWKKARDESEKDGKIVDKVERMFFTPTEYSPMK